MDTLTRWIDDELTQSEYRTISVLTHPDARIALRFWEDRPVDGIHIGRDVPSRAIGHLLSHIAVYAPLPDGSDALVHLAGSGLRLRFGHDITGEMMSTSFKPEECRLRMADINAVVAGGLPRMAQVNYHVSDIEILRVELFSVPAIAPNGTDRWALSFAFYF